MFLYGGGDTAQDAKFRLAKDVKAITNDQIVELSQITKRSHQMVTRVMRAIAEPMLAQPARGAWEADGCRTQPYFWFRWDPAFWSPVSFLVESGSISESLTDETSRSLNLRCHSDAWRTFESFQTEVSPFHTLLRVERGVRIAQSKTTPPDSYGGDTTIWVPLGIYRVHKANFNRDHTADIEAYSLEQVLKDFLYDAIPAPLTAAKTWMQLFEEKWLAGGLDAPGQQDYAHVTYEIRDSITNLALAAVQAESYSVGFQVANSFNRWAGIKEMLDQRHFKLYVNRVGKPIVVRILQPNDQLVTDVVPQEIEDQLVLAEGDDGNLVSRTEDFSRDGMFNMVVAYGQIGVDDSSTGEASKPYTTVVTDNNPASPTYIGGPFGRVAVELHVENLLNQGKLAVAGQAKLDESLILTTRSSFSLLPNPTIEVGDRVKVHYPDGSFRWYIIDTLEIPLTADSELAVTGYTYDNARVDPSIGIPQNLAIVSGPTDTGVTIAFDAVVGATGYEWSSDAVAFWTPVPTTVLPGSRVQMVITGLRPLANYSIRVRASVADDYVAPPVQRTSDGRRITRRPASLLVAEGGWPGRFLDDAPPANIVMANLAHAFHVLPPPGSPAQLNDPWDPNSFIVMGDGMLATWNGNQFMQRL